MTRSLLSIAGCLLAAGLALAGCGDSSTPMAPSPGPGAGPIAATITITSGGVSPQDVTVAQGSRVMFVNNASVAHEMASDPHPLHTECPPINVIGVLQPGQSRATGNLNTVRTCGFHDHLRDTDASLRGTIRVQ